MARRWPDFRFAYSRPGFLTFKLPPEHKLEPDFELGSVFARSYGFSLGKASGETPDDRAKNIGPLIAGRTFDQLHVWQRDTAAPGDRDFEPGITPAATEAEQAIRNHVPALAALRPPTKAGHMVADCIIVEPNEWWIGYHKAHGRSSCLPGGLSKIDLPADVVSRAYLKMEEAIRWSRLPIEKGQECVEIGCAPGGSCQALLNRGLRVIGIDPAAMHASVLANRNFVHIRKRGNEVKKKEFRKTRWLVADMNVAPQYTLDTVEEIVTYPQVNIRGLLLTLKLLEWDLAEEVPQYLERIRGWGYAHVRARQLQYNRQEICVAAQK